MNSDKFFKAGFVFLLFTISILFATAVSASPTLFAEDSEYQNRLNTGLAFNPDSFTNFYNGFDGNTSTSSDLVQTYTSSTTSLYYYGKTFDEKYVENITLVFSNTISSTSTTFRVRIEYYNGSSWIDKGQLYSTTSTSSGVQTLSMNIQEDVQGIRARIDHSRSTTASRTFTTKIYDFYWHTNPKTNFMAELELYGNKYVAIGNQSGHTFRDDTVYPYDGNFEYWGFECSSSVICDGNWATYALTSADHTRWSNIITPIFPKTIRVRVSQYGSSAQYAEYDVDSNCDFTNNVLRIRNSYTNSDGNSAFQCYDESDNLITLGTVLGSGNFWNSLHGIVAKLDPVILNRILDFYGSNDGTLNGYTFNDGTVSGGVTIEDGAMVFDGVNGVVTINGYDGNFRTNSLWFNNNGDDIIIGDSNLIQNIQITPSVNRVRAEITNSDNTVTKRFDTTITLPLGANHILIMQNDDGSNNQIWVNGVKYYDDVGVTLPNRLLSTYRFGFWNTNYYNTSIYLMNHYNRSLSPTEITEIYNAGKDTYSPITDGLIAQYSGRDFEGTEASPTIIKDMNHIVTTENNRTGMRFDGVDDFVTIPDSNSLDLSSAGTWSLWVNAKSQLTTPDGHRPLDKPSAYGITVGKTSGRVDFFNVGLSSTYVLGTGTNVYTNSWNHILITYDGSNVRFYQNNVLKNTVAVTGNISNSSNALVLSQNSTRSFKGSISDVRIFNRSLNSTEIADLYNNPLSTAGIDALVAYYPLQAPMFNKIQNLNYTANITFGATNYFSNFYEDQYLFSSFTGVIDPFNVLSFNILTTNNFKTTNDIINLTWSASGSPTEKELIYAIEVLDFNNNVIDYQETDNLYATLNFTNNNAGVYTAKVTATQDGGDTFARQITVLVDKTNYVHFQKQIDSTPINNSSVSVKKPSGATESLTTDSNGRINFQSFTNTVFEIGTYEITLLDIQGFTTPITLNVTVNETQMPFNETFSISSAQLNFEMRDAFSGNLITAMVYLQISNIGSYNTTNGTLSIVNASLVSGNYTVLATSQSYTVAQRTFEFTNQEILNIGLFMIETNSTNLGTIFVNTYDSFLDVIPNADLRLQEFNPVTATWSEVTQASTGSGGDASFQIFLNTKKYRILATATIGGQVYSEYSNIAGEFFYTNGQVVNIYFNTIIDTGVGTEGLVVEVSNTTLINNVSFHRVDFFDNQGLTHEVCLAYYYMHGVQKKLYPSGLTCVNGSSGTIQAVGGTALDGSKTNVVEVFAKINNQPNKIYYSQRYEAIGGFNTHFGDLVKPLIAVLSLTFLAIALYLRRIDIFLYLSVLSTAIWSLVSPSIISGSGIVIVSVFSAMILYLAKKRTGGEQV